MPTYSESSQEDALHKYMHGAVPIAIPKRFWSGGGGGGGGGGGNKNKNHLSAGRIVGGP